MEASRGELRLAVVEDVPTAVISASLADQLGTPDQLVGKTLVIRDRSYLIAGVAALRFRGLQAARECDVWVPLSGPATARGNRRLGIVGRLAPGRSLTLAQQQLDQLSTELATRFPQTNRGNVNEADAPRRFTVKRYSHLTPGSNTQTFLLATVIGGASVLLLMSACLNAGGLLISWAVARRRELAIKMALGATRDVTRSGSSFSRRWPCRSLAVRSDSSSRSGRRGLCRRSS